MDGTTTTPLHELPTPASLNDDGMLCALHERIGRLHAARLAPAFPDDEPGLDARAERALIDVEQRFLAHERRLVAVEAARAPTDAAGFVAWFEALKATGPGQHDALFPWLAEDATSTQLKWFLTQELAGEAGFEDLVALTQVKMPTAAKLEMARNYWDEMGRGNPSGMHGPMLGDMGTDLELDASRDIVWESLALSSLMVGLATTRAYAFHSVGALGVIELTAPDRATLVNKALDRLGVPGKTRRYYALHATLDVKHSAAWNREVLTSLVESDPRSARAIAEGALMRLNAGARCFARYRAELWGSSQRPALARAAS